jgi:hypothetical protein
MVKNWYRLRFYGVGSDPRPIKSPPPGPWWCTGSCDSLDDGDAYINVAYVKAKSFDKAEDIILKYWPDAYDIDESGGNGPPEFSDRFPAHEDWDIEKQKWKK